MSEILSKSAFAARRGVRPSAISNWLKTGKLDASCLTADRRVIVDVAEKRLAGVLHLGRAVGQMRPQSAAPAPEGDPIADKARSAARKSEIELRRLERRDLEESGELVRRKEYDAAHGRELAGLFAAIEIFHVDLAAALGLDAAGLSTIRREWRHFRSRQVAAIETRLAAMPELVDAA